MEDVDQDKKGSALKAQRFQMLEDIANELSGEVVFPTYFDAILRLRKLLQDPNQSLANIAKAITLEPLISAKLLHLANSVAFNPNSQQLHDVKSAISRLGLNTVRSAAFSVVMTQLLRSRSLAGFAEIAHRLWEHSLATAAAACVIARETTRLSPDAAMLAGMVHDLGAFYMLYRATQYEELRHRPDSIKYLMVQWHESIGVSLLSALGLPEDIIEATVEHDRVRPLPEVTRTLADVVYAANMLSGGHFEWVLQDQPAIPSQLDELEQRYGELRPRFEALAAEMRNGMD